MITNLRMDLLKHKLEAVWNIGIARVSGEDARELCSVQEGAAVIKTMDEANNLC